MKEKTHTTIPSFISTSKIYKPNEINEVIKESVCENQLIKNNKKICYYNIPCAFDIETTSFYIKHKKTDEKASIMYEWTLGINGRVIIGRTWSEFMYVINKICELLTLGTEKRLVVYVHNLAYEMQFIRKHFTWLSIFSVKERKPLKAITTNGIEFRCSYLLSGYSLENLGKELKKYPVTKMVGNLDYSLIRHSQTPLTESELKYCENDVRVVMAYIQEQIEIEKYITRIPLTKTGYVRRYCRNACLYSGSHKNNTKKWHLYKQLMQALTIEPEEYKQLKRAFQGGFTHASAWKSGKIYENVESFDFTSSYPAVMIAERFPMSKGKIVTIKSKSDFINYLKNYCCLFDVKFINLASTTYIEHPLSSSRCSHLTESIEDNGRVVKANECITTLTEQDYFIMENFYKWDKIEIANFRIYHKGYLPTDFVESIMKLYQKKTELKGIKDAETDYMLSKGMLNACYGMCVTDICRDEVKCNGESWWTESADITKQINKYNNSKGRFLSYAWGVWVTAYARRNLFYGIKEFGTDYIYSDTDSIKAINADKHTDFINKYNEWITKRIEKALISHGLPLELAKPKTIKGIEKPLGVWDDEGMYQRFKTLGAKRYMTEKDGEISITVSGLNKSVCVPYILNNYDDAFTAFNDSLYIPAEFTGKNTHTYIDYPQHGTLIDYLGNKSEFSELSSVHMEEADYSLSLSVAYINYLLGIREDIEQ